MRSRATLPSRRRPPAPLAALVPTLATLAAALVSGAAAAQADTAADRPDLPDPQQALADYDSLVEASLEAWRVPGVAVSVVVDGEVVVADGWGVRDRSTGEPVTPETLFPIGSATKAFTSLLVADLVEQGELAWDRPVHDVLPGFRLHEDYATLHATPVDLLSHRTGVPRHDLAWIGAGPEPGFGRDEAMRRLPHFRPSAGFRSTFQYNNWMFMAAGRMAAALTGGTWEEAVRRRLLAPMGMDRTTFWVDSMTARSDHAAGYRTEFTGPDGQPLEEPVVEATDYFNPGPLGPAGSIISTAGDMARWLELQMSDGRVDGRRVVPEAAVRATHTRRIAVQGQVQQLVSQPELSGVDYGLGWFVQHYRGHRLVHHAGGIDGFSALVGVLPDREIGVSVLTNNESSALTFALLFSTLDRLLGLEPRDWNGRYRGVMQKMLEAMRSSSPDTADAGGEPDHALEAYTGRYTHPGYGKLTVRRAGGGDAKGGGDGGAEGGSAPGAGAGGDGSPGGDGSGLEVAYHGFTLPLDHRAHDVFRARVTGTPLAAANPVLHFRTDARGEIRAVAVPLEPRLQEPIVFEKAPGRTGAQVPRAVLESYAGRYTLAGLTIEVRLRGDGTLVLDQPGRPTLEMEPTGKDAFRVARAGASADVEFVREGGRVAAMVLSQAGRTFRAEKVREDGGDGG